MPRTTTKTTEENNTTDKDKIDYLEKQIQELLKITETLQQNKTSDTPKIETIAKVETKDDSRPVKVISLSFGVFNLLNGVESQAKTFSRYGETRIIPCSKLRDYLNYDFSYNHMLQGSFYIADADLVKEYGLEDLYENLLSKEIIDSIINYSDIDLTSMLESAPEIQKENICLMLAHKVYKKEINDPYKIQIISKACNIDIDEKVRQIKATVENNEKEEE